jgi:hypothetical protein
MKTIPQKIIAEAARVALAHRQFEESATKIRRRLKVRRKVLKRDPRATHEEAFEQLCDADPEMRQLAHELLVREAFRDVVINYCCVPTIEDGGTVRWTLPICVKRPN